MECPEKFEKFISRNKLFSKQEKILLAVSGGLDSTVMTALFHKCKFNFGIAHCNFKLRGDDADGDEAFVKKLAAKYDVPFYSASFDTKSFAKKNKLSVQEAARNLRFEWMHGLCKNEGYRFLATAHHFDDSVETFFINLLRGTGISGLAGILPVNKMNNVVRPMLFASRKEIESFARQKKIKFRHDASNDTDAYLRNRIRHHLIPLLLSLNPDFEKVMHRNLDNLHFARNVYESFVSAKFHSLWTGDKQKKLHREKIEAEAFPFELFTAMVRQMGFNASQAHDIWSSVKTGSQVSSEVFTLTNDRTGIMLSRNEKKDDGLYSIAEGQNETLFPGGRLKTSLLKYKPGLELKNKPFVYALSLESLNFPLVMRKWKAGDAFQPLGMKMKKKISDFLTDRKVSRPDKEKTYVLLSGNDIVCVLGHRIDERYKVTATTKNIYTIELLKND